MSEPRKVTLLMSEFVTHDVKRFVLSRPKGFSFEPGQGVELSIDHPDWREQGRPFTPTGFVDDEVLEFTIKRYDKGEGVTRELHQLRAGASLMISDAFGTISYKGPGVFLAGGAGITPFLAILRQQARTANLADHQLIFSNKTSDDIICEKELQHYLGKRCILSCTREQETGYLHSRIDKDFLTSNIQDFEQNFYVCGPPGFTESVNKALKQLGANPQSLIFEQ